MTSTLQRPPLTRATTGGTRSGLVGTVPVAAVTAATWSALVGLVVLGVVVIVVWAVSGRGDDGIATPLQASGVVWLAAHHASVETPTATLTLLPLALLALPIALLFRSGRWAARITRTNDWPDAVMLVVTGTATYAALGLLLSQVSSLGDAHVPASAALGWTALMAALGLGAGVASGADLLADVVRLVPAAVRRMGVVAATAGSVCAMVAGLATAAAIVTRWSTVVGLSGQLSPGPWESLGVLVTSLAYLPNLVVWALAYVSGPGFAVGGGAVVDPFSVSGSLLPAMPVLGAVPADAAPLAPLLLLLPAVAGAVGVLVLRRRSSGLSLRDEVVAAVGGAALVGLGMLVLSALASGSLGSARLADLGPDAPRAAAALAALVAGGAVLAVLTAHLVGLARLPRLAHLLPTIWVRDDEVIELRER